MYIKREKNITKFEYSYIIIMHGFYWLLITKFYNMYLQLAIWNFTTPFPKFAIFRKKIVNNVGKSQSHHTK